MLLIENATKSYGGRKVFSNLSLRVDNDQIITIVGPNGCGKSTLLNAVARLTPLDGGTITASDTPQGKSSIVGYVWQDYRASLLPWRSSVDNVAFPLQLKGFPAVTRRAQARELISLFLPSIDPDAPCYRLSGGQQQLLNLLRCAIVAPVAYLLDEPFSALDQERRWAAALFVEQVWSARPVPTLFVSHDVDEAILLGDTVILMSADGSINRQIPITLPRPRSLEMLKSAAHISCREEILDFLFAESAVVFGDVAARLNGHGSNVARAKQ